MLPPAPARFSTMTCWPSCSPRGFCRMRAVVSVPPPGSKPTTIVTGLAGKPCAAAAAAKAMPNTAPRMRVSTLALILFPLKIRFAFLHEGLAALDVIGAVEALLDPRIAARRIEVRLQHFGD